VAHQKLGKIYSEVGRGHDARRQLEQARHLAEDLAVDSPGDLAITECLLKTYNGLGLLDLADREATKARRSFARAVALAQAITKAEPRRPGARRGLISAYLELGRAYGFEGNLDEAEVWFGRSLAMADRWFRDEPGNTQAAEMQAWSYRKLADMRKHQGDPAGARKFYLEAIRIGHGLLAAEPANAEFKQNLGVALHDLARLLLSQRELTLSRPSFQEAERLFLELTLADPEDLQSQIWLVRAQADFGRMEREEREFPRAAAHFRSARDRLALLKKEGRLDGRADLGVHFLDDLTQDLRDCESVSLALADLPSVVARPPEEARRLLLMRARVQASQGQLADVRQSLEALCGLKAGQAADLYDQARCLAEGAACLDDVRWTPDTTPQRTPLRERCTARALALLSQAVERGFDDLPRLENDGALVSLRQQPAYRALLLRHKDAAPAAPHPSGVD
jgi:tetratricopeptide (TPR) repeat protein